MLPGSGCCCVVRVESNDVREDSSFVGMHIARSTSEKPSSFMRRDVDFIEMFIFERSK